MLTDCQNSFTLRLPSNYVLTSDFCKYFLLMLNVLLPFLLKLEKWKLIFAIAANFSGIFILYFKYCTTNSVNHYCYIFFIMCFVKFVVFRVKRINFDTKSHTWWFFWILKYHRVLWQFAWNEISTVVLYRVAQNKIPHQTICNIFATSGQILKILEAV